MADLPTQCRKMAAIALETVMAKKGWVEVVKNFNFARTSVPGCE